MILCDTNILIEFFKRNPVITAALREIGVNQLAVSHVTMAELYFGALNKKELSQIKAHLQALHVLPVTDQTSHCFLGLMESWSLSHQLSIPDALIAATALNNDLDLYTLNIKDFRFIEGLKLHLPEE